ncbi:hypothetical protein [Photobacterium rosenbergii]|uniref:Transferrin-binding protein B C-lobe/N-lobe beta barrel domain-containing protein n=1 Tax=Photobacterium rosenbergii TaxID=294936 RepID=A0ABU3ZFD9_9GAMM|nr:hypothetical protein [Photobacterium rosenbergii]MDV5168820.1 hypothetical protein [Photobacterium rosenbergii]
MKKILVMLLTVLITACGGGSGSSGEANTAGTESSTKFDGLFQSGEAVMLVDKANAGKVLISDGTAILYFDNIYTLANELRLTGVAAIADGFYFHEPSQIVSIYYEADIATVSTTINGEPFVYSFERQTDKLESLDSLVGTFTDPMTGESWSLDSAANLTINADCTLSGKLISKVSFYHTVDVDASGCSDSGFDGSYGGMAFNVTVDSTKYLAGFIYNDDKEAYMWGSVPLN